MCWKSQLRMTLVACFGNTPLLALPVAAEVDDADEEEQEDKSGKRCC